MVIDKKVRVLVLIDSGNPYIEEVSRDLIKYGCLVSQVTPDRISQKENGKIVIELDSLPNASNIDNDEFIQERRELHPKIEKLKNFLKTEDFKKLPSAEQSVILRQLDAMKDYYAILRKRMYKF